MSDSASGKPDHQLHILKDPAGKKMADKLFELYVGKEDHTRSAEFCIALDRLLSEFGGKELPEEDDDRPKRKSNDNSYGDEENIHDDEDSEETSSVDLVKMAIAKVLRRNS